MTEQQYLIRPAHINPYGRLFGAQLLKWIDELAGIVAIRHCGSTVTTAAIDNLQFKAPAHEGDLIVLRGMVTYVGRSSMEVRVDTYKEEMDGTRMLVNRAYIDMVAIDSEGHPVEVPELLVETEEEKLEQSINDKGYLEQCFYRIYFREYYRQQDIYNGGLMEQIKGTAKVIDTKYYKSQGVQTNYLCGSKEYEFLKNNG